MMFFGTPRYFCISNAFDRCLRKSGNTGVDDAMDGSNTTLEVSKGTPPPSSSTQPFLFRNNIINLNYTIVQLARLESKSLFVEMAPYFPQLYSQYQPRINNARWRKLIDYCQREYREVADPVHGDLYGFEWDRGFRTEVWEEGGDNSLVSLTHYSLIDLNALTQEDLLKYFFYFQ